MLTMPAYVAGQGMSVKLVGVPRANNRPYRDLFGQFLPSTTGTNENYENNNHSEKNTRSEPEVEPKQEAVAESTERQRRRQPLEEQKTGLPATTIVVEEKSGNVKSIINSRHLTALRTAAGSLLATELLLGGAAASSSSHTAPHEADGGRTRPKTLVLFGAGLQIQYHAELLLARFPTIQCCHIINRSKNERGKHLWGRLMDRYGQTKKITLSGLYGDDGAAETVDTEKGKGPVAGKDAAAKQAKIEETSSDHARSQPIRLVDDTAKRYAREGDIVCFATSASEPLATTD
jgi:hypothetical protein